MQASCDFDSGSDCADAYERETMAVLESFTNDNCEARDSAIYSDGEDSPLMTSMKWKHGDGAGGSETGRSRSLRVTGAGE